MELKDLASKLGVVNIIVSHINNDYYKDSFTIVINNDLVMNYVGKTYSFIPLTGDGIGKALTTSSVKMFIERIKDELKEQSL